MQKKMDYRQLNGQIHAFPLPQIEESSNSFSGATLFSTLDIASDYNQVPVAERDESKIAFCTPFGLFKFSWMLF